MAANYDAAGGLPPIANGAGPILRQRTDLRILCDTLVSAGVVSAGSAQGGAPAYDTVPVGVATTLESVPFACVSLLQVCIKNPADFSKQCMGTYVVSTALLSVGQPDLLNVTPLYASDPAVVVSVVNPGGGAMTRDIQVTVPGTYADPSNNSYVYWVFTILPTGFGAPN